MCTPFFFLAAKKKAVIVSFRQDTKILTADRTAGSDAVCKAVIDNEFSHNIVKVVCGTTRPLRQCYDEIQDQ